MAGKCVICDSTDDLKMVELRIGWGAGFVGYEPARPLCWKCRRANNGAWRYPGSAGSEPQYHPCKIGSHGSTSVVFRYNYKPRPGLRMTVREFGKYGWLKVIVDEVHDNGFFKAHRI